MLPQLLSSPSFNCYLKFALLIDIILIMCTMFSLFKLFIFTLFIFCMITYHLKHNLNWYLEKYERL